MKQCNIGIKNNEELVNQAFTNQSVIFDDLNEGNKITLHLRNIFYQEIERQTPPPARILELNCGTGIDSIYLARRGYQVFATDLSSGMLKQLQQKLDRRQLARQIQTMQCSFTDLSQLGDKRFDYIISNFGGLNCTNQLDEVLKQFGNYLSPHGKITLAIMPKISPWEIIRVFRGDIKTTFRRFKKNPIAHIEGVYFPVYYYSPSYVKKILKQNFEVLSLRGVYFLSPPEAYKTLAEKYPRLYHFSQKAENVLSHFFPFTYCCDHFIITLQKKE